MKLNSIGLSCVILFLTMTYSKSQDITIEKKLGQDIIYSIDTLFKPAANSSGYLVIRDFDLEKLKSTISIRLNEKSSIKNSIVSQRVDTVYIEASQSFNSKPLESNESENKQLIWILLTAIFMSSCVVLIFINSKSINKVKDSTERLKTLEGDFDKHKKNSVERERKLMRELIDARRAE